MSAQIAKKERRLVCVPTYNERENVQPLLLGILGLGLPIDVLFVDDDSPDGTGTVLDEIADAHANVRVLHRRGKNGIGSAHRDALFWAYEEGYRRVATMDADLTHSPHHLPRFFSELDAAPAVVGSRYMHDGSLRTWNVFRKTLTRTAHVATRELLGIDYDATGAYRAYDLGFIPREIFSLVSSDTYAFFFESLYVLHVNGFAVKEIPIELPARTYGSSKMALKDAASSLGVLVRTMLQSKVAPESFLWPQRGDGDEP